MSGDSRSRSSLNSWSHWDPALSLARCLAVVMVWLLVPVLTPTWRDAGYWRSGVPAPVVRYAATPLAEDQMEPWPCHQRWLTQDATSGHEASLLASVERTFPSLTDKLGQRAHFVESISGASKGWRPTHEAMAPAGLKPEERQAWLAMGDRQRSTSGRLDIFFPAIFTRPQEVAADGLRLEVHAVGARSVCGQVVDGRIVYADAWPETDVIYTAGVGHSEEFLSMRNASAPTVFVHRISAMPGAAPLTHVTVQTDGSIEVEDAQGHQVRIAKPYVVDALGTHSEQAVYWRVEPASQAKSWDVRMEVQTSGLTYPLLVDPSWVTARYMNQSRAAHTATLLPSGRVLVVGGSNNLSHCELFDPSSGSWASVGSLAVGRSSHTATLLASGKVLVIGGRGRGVGTDISLASAEIFDPTTGAWSSLGSMTAARSSHTATLLSSGKVLVTGGYGLSTNLTSAEVFDPTTGSWTDAGSMSVARSFHTATELSTGKILIVGNGSYNPSCELFDPMTGTWTLTGSLVGARDQHTATLLPSGKVMVVGGAWGPQAGLGTVELYDPAAGTWTSTGSLITARKGHTATLLPSGKVMVVGGLDANTRIATAEVYNPASGTWTSPAALTTARSYHSATLLASGKVLVLGGENNSGNLNTTEVYDPAVGTWGTTGSLATPRPEEYTATVLPSGKVLVTGGRYPSGDSRLASVELFDPVTGLWSTVAPMGRGRTEHTATLLPSGKVLVVGGRGVSGQLASAELFDPVSQTWTDVGSLAFPRSGHTATLLGSGQVLVAGGSDLFYLVPQAERFDPSTGSWSAAGALVTPRVGHTASLLASGMVLVVAGTSGNFLSSAEMFNPATGQWSNTGSLATPRHHPIAAVLSSGKVLVVGGSNSASLTSAEIFDPVSGIWSSTGSMVMARTYSRAAVLPSGKVLMADGAGSELFDPDTGTWASTAPLLASRYGHALCVLPSNRVLVAGGSVNNGELLSFDNDSSRIPQLTAVDQGNAVLTCSGSSFAPLTGGSSGGTHSSPANLPCVQLQHMDGRLWHLFPVTSYSGATTAVAIPPDAAGPSWVRVSVNGICSPAIYVNILPPQITAITSSKVAIQDNGDSAILTVHLGRRYNLPVTVDLQLSGAASSPDDFTIAAQRLIIAAGSTEASTTITGRNVSRVSGDRGLTITVASATNGQFLLPAPSVDLVIASSNHAPLIASTINALPGIVGGQTSADTPVTKLFFGKISDEDPTDGKGIAVTSLSGGGKWWFTISNGAVWTEIGSVSDTSALLLSEAGSTQVRYESVLGFPENASITYRAWDRTSRNEGERVDVSVLHGGTTAFSTATSSTTLPVTSQAAPVVTLSGTTATWTEGTPALQIDGGAICIDVDSLNFAGGNITVTIAPNNRFGDRLTFVSVLTGGITRSGNELRTASGVLLGTLSGGEDGAQLVIALTAATTPAIAQTMLRGLTYANVGGNPESTPTGQGQRSIVITVDDETGARGTSQTKTVTIQPVDDAPVVEPLTLSLVPGLTVSNQLVANDPEGLALTFVQVTTPTKGEPTLDLNTGSITYRNTVLDGQDDSFQVRISDGTHSTLTTVNVKITAGNQGGLRFTSAPPQVWRAGVVLSYTPSVTGTAATVRFSLVPAPQVAKTGAALDPSTFSFDPSTGTLTIPSPVLPDGDYLRFGILAVDRATGVSTYQPVLVKIVLAGSG